MEKKEEIGCGRTYFYGKYTGSGGLQLEERTYSIIALIRNI